jgi:hypothetical protein
MFGEPFDNSVAISADGKLALSARYDGTLKFWDLATGGVIGTLTRHWRPVTSVAFSPPDGKTALSGSVDGTLKLWDLSTGRDIHTFTEHSGANSSVALSPDGKTALSGSVDKTLKLWDLASGRYIHSLEGHSLPVVSVAISLDGTTALSSGGDLRLGNSEVKLWNLATRQHIAFEGHSGFVHSVTFSPDRKTALSGGEDGTIRVWNVASGDELMSFATSSRRVWLAMTPPRAGGFFSASSVENKLLSIVRGLELTSIEQVYQSLFSPDLVREALAGDPDHEVETAAKGLNLEKVLDRGKPPLASIVTPAMGAQLRADIVTAGGTISDEGGGIGRIEWRVNGLTVGVENAPPGAKKTLPVSRALPLDRGENVIELVAYNGRNLVASVAAEIIVTSTAAETGVKPTLRAIVFGLNDYGCTLPTLHYARDDAIAVGAALKAASKDLYQSVDVAYVLDPATPSEGIRRIFEPTSAGLEKAFEVVGKDASVHDTFVFFAAGHGSTVNGRFYLLAKDYHRDGDIDASIVSHGIGQDKLQALIANKIRAKRGLVLLDTCESGAAVTGAIPTVSATPSAAFCCVVTPVLGSAKLIV